MPGVLLTTQAAGRSEVPCSDVVAGDSPDTAPLCSQCVENETHAALTAARTAGLETALGSDLIAEANTREDAASPKQYQEVSELQGSCPSFDPLGNSCSGYEETMIASSRSAGAVVKTSLVERLRGGDCDADRVSGAHSVASSLEPVDTVVATPVAVAWELPDSNREPRGELTQIGSSVATEAEASTDRLEARTLRRGLSQAQCREDSPHTFEAHPLQSNFCWRRPAEEMGGPSRVSTAAELTVGARSILVDTLSYRSLCSHCLCRLAIVMSHAPARACPAGVTGESLFQDSIGDPYPPGLTQEALSGLEVTKGKDGLNQDALIAKRVPKPRVFTVRYLSKRARADRSSVNDVDTVADPNPYRVP
ncbi:hypothetical protein HPB50_007254 [Hyalomma asiaticum]|uniref:Uncharacterized protein n=1 Tax=Hyalomma asiaticum TaxID=266040 RepID=A0ACB7TGF1_HYAAI|nr:hypothetical protein HPB50_007254 [Hyalomma asiaticum]